MGKSKSVLKCDLKSYMGGWEGAGTL